MFKPVVLYLGLRYIFSTARDGFISFVSFSSIATLAIGVAILITVCSVMNGFDRTIQNKLGVHIKQVDIHPLIDTSISLNELKNKLSKIDSIVSIAPYVKLNGAVNYNKYIIPTVVYGVYANDLEHFGVFSTLKNKFGIILGGAVNSKIITNYGSKINLIIPKINYSVFGVTPVSKRFVVEGFEDTNNIAGAFINMDVARVLLADKDVTVDFSLILEQGRDVQNTVNEIKNILGDGFLVIDWSQRFGNLFKAIAMQKTMMTIVLTLLVIMACFNLLSSLVMMVNARGAEIAILRTMGMSKRSVMCLFMAQGCIAGVVGIFLGVVLGWLLSDNIGQIAQAIEYVIGKKIISKDVYWVDTLPSEFLWQDVGFVVSVSFALCMVATIYPACKAARLMPSRVLRSKG